jgi:hypothetical protein
MLAALMSMVDATRLDGEPKTELETLIIRVNTYV